MWLETPADRAREDAVAALLQKAWRCDVERQPQGSRVDRHFFRYGHLVGVGEIKCRDISPTQYPTVWLELDKYNAIRGAAFHHSVPGIWVVSFQLSHQIRWIYADHCQLYHRILGGRTDRGLPEDIDLMIEVPVADMNQVQILHKP